MTTMQPQSHSQIIRVLSIKQPYASWIVHSSKFCENRTWSTKHRGELYIHASSWDSEAGPGNHEQYDYPVHVGRIIGRVNLLGCWPVDTVIDAQFAYPDEDQDLTDALRRLSAEPRNFFGGWDTVEGPVCWLMSDRQPLVEPIEVKGKLNVWRYDVDPEQLQFVEKNFFG